MTLNRFWITNLKNHRAEPVRCGASAVRAVSRPARVCAHMKWKGSRAVKIKLTQTIKADAKHGLFAGHVFDATIATGRKTVARWQIISDAGRQVDIFSAEAEIVEE